jgi:uncharacterized protein with PQ loop repeat
MKKEKETKMHRMFRRKIDYLIYFIGIITPFSLIPQITQIWFGQNVAGVSVWSWLIMIFFAFFWLAYGIIHKYKPIIITNILWISAEIAVVIGYFIYI